MGNCANCGAALDSAWKYCTTCGAPIEPAHETPVETVVEPIPGAIRPPAEPDDPEPPKDRSGLVGIIVAVVGLALIIIVATLVFSSNG